MKRIILIMGLFAIFMVIFAAFVVSGADMKNQGTEDGKSKGPVILPISYKENESDSDWNGNETDDHRANKTKKPKVNKTKDNESNETEDENETRIEVNETEHGKRGFPPGLNQSITRGNPSNRSIEVRIRNIEQIREKFQEINESINKTENPGLRIGQYVKNLEDISDLMENESIGKRVSEIAKNINKSLEKSKQAEEKIKGRNSIIRFLFGGDKNSAKDIEGVIADDQRDMEELRRIESKSGEDVKPLIENHIKVLEAENGRLGAVSRSEIMAFSLFGWLF